MNSIITGTVVCKNASNHNTNTTGWCYVLVAIIVSNTMVTDKSLARPTSRCRRTESIVSLERGVCVHVPNCKSFLVTEAERKHVRWSARFQQHRDASCHKVLFFSCKARRPRKFTPFWQKHSGNIHHLMTPSKIGWPTLNVVIFLPVLRLVLDDPKQWPPRRILNKFTS